MQDSAMLNAKPKFSVVPGTLWFQSCWKGHGVLHFLCVISEPLLCLGGHRGSGLSVYFYHCFRSQLYFFFLIH